MQRVSLSLPVLVAISPALIQARWLEATTIIPLAYDWDTGDSITRPGSATNWTDWTIPAETLALRNFLNPVTMDGCSNNIIRDPGAILDTITYWRYNVNPDQEYFINRLEIHAGSDCNDEDPYIIALDSIDGYGGNEFAEEIIDEADNIEPQQEVQEQPEVLGYKGGDFWELYNSPTDRERQAGLFEEEDSGIFASQSGPFKKLARRTPQVPDPDSEEGKSDKTPPRTNFNNPSRATFRQLNFDAPIGNAPFENPTTNNPLVLPQFNFNPSGYRPQLQPPTEIQNNPLQQSYGGYLMQRIRSAPTEEPVFEASQYERNRQTDQQPRAFRRLTFDDDNDIAQGEYNRIDPQLRPKRNQGEVITFEEGVQEQDPSPLLWNFGPPVFRPREPGQPAAFRRLNFPEEDIQFEDMRLQQDSNIQIEDPENLLNADDVLPNQGTQNAIDFLRNGGTYLEEERLDGSMEDVEDLPPNDGRQRLFIADVGGYDISGDISFKFVVDPLVLHDPDAQQHVTFEEAQELLRGPTQPNDY
ncbi:hypothetical protein TWF696_004899 [Orbilia brochopaga]|uniref:Uncharacterized protein n=1 Tax=Orbilia brochopaga TaxID=3140254 RepID=A0AAV9UZ37_9PEZI